MKRYALMLSFALSTVISAAATADTPSTAITQPQPLITTTPAVPAPAPVTTPTPAATPEQSAAPILAPLVPAIPRVFATTTVLALDKILPGATEDKIKALLADEARAALTLYLSGQIRQWYFRQDRPGAIFLLDASSLEAAQKTLDNLPLSKAGLIAYDLIPVGPYIPISALLIQKDSNDAATKKSRRKK